MADMQLGVGDGTGNLFVYGSYEAIKTAQKKLIELEELRRKTEELERELDEFAAITGSREALARRDARVAAEALDNFVDWAVDRCNDWHRRGGVVTTKDIYGEANRRAHELRREAEEE